MERRTWIPQAYGYLVCLIAVITMLITLNGLIDAGFRRTSPGNGTIVREERDEDPFDATAADISRAKCAWACLSLGLISRTASK